MRLTILCHADDAVLLTEIANYPQPILHNFETVCEKLNTLILTRNTKLTIIAKEPIRWKLVADNTPTEPMMSFKHLTVQIISADNTAMEVHTQSMEATSTSGCS